MVLNMEKIVTNYPILLNYLIFPFCSGWASDIEFTKIELKSDSETFNFDPLTRSHFSNVFLHHIH